MTPSHYRLFPLLRDSDGTDSERVSDIINYRENSVFKGATTCDTTTNCLLSSTDTGTPEYPTPSLHTPDSCPLYYFTRRSMRLVESGTNHQPLSLVARSLEL